MHVFARFDTLQRVSRRLPRRLRDRDVDDLGAERGDQVGRREVEVHAVRAAADGDRLEPSPTRRRSPARHVSPRTA